MEKWRWLQQVPELPGLARFSACRTSRSWDHRRDGLLAELRWPTRSAAGHCRRQLGRLAELITAPGIDDAVGTCRPDSLADAQQMVEAALGHILAWTEAGLQVATMWRPLPRWLPEYFDAVMDANVRGAWLVSGGRTGAFRAVRRQRGAGVRSRRKAMPRTARRI